MADRMYKNMKTADMGTSTLILGTPPTAAVVGAYGGPLGWFDMARDGFQN